MATMMMLIAITIIIEVSFDENADDKRINKMAMEIIFIIIMKTLKNYKKIINCYDVHISFLSLS